MRRPIQAGAAAAVLTVLGVTVAITPAAPSAAAPAPVAAAPAAPTTSASRVLPPSAPSPTSTAKSPDAPDPHPPRGGIGPDGRAVGGTRLLSRSLVLPAGAPKPPSSLTAASWIVVDLDSGAVLGARDPHGRYQPASVLKTLTALTLLPLLPGTRVVTVSSAAAHAEGSSAGLVAGGHYTVDQLFEGLLLVSGNDTAAALAQAAGGVSHTVALMNDRARALGAYDTFVQTPSGLDGWQQLTSVYDIALFLRAALAQPRFAAYDRRPKAVLPAQPGVTGPITLHNQNELFLTTVPGALVAKTGFTDAAQHTFLGAIKRGGHRYGVIFLRAQRWPTDQWQQARDLVNWAARLPAGTAPVGQLVTPPPAPPVSAARSGAAAVRAVALASAHGPHRSAGWWWILAVVAAIALAAWPIGRRLHRHRT